MAWAWTWGPPGPGGRAPPSPRRLRAVRNVRDEVERDTQEYIQDEPRGAKREDPKRRAPSYI